MGKAVLILGFRRSTETINLASQVIDQGAKKIYLHLDGPKADSDKVAQEFMITQIERQCLINNVEFHFLWQKENLGLMKAVRKALHWFFTLEKEGYVLEDDLVLSDQFFSYCERYKPLFDVNQKLLMISGNQFEPNLESGVYLSEYPFIWGWFTTAKNWRTCEELISGNYLGIRTRLPLRVKEFWKIGTWKVQQGYLNSWAIPLASGFREFGFYCLVPSTNLVSNIGNDQFATHTKSINLENSMGIDEKKASEMMLLPYQQSPSVQSSKFVEDHIYRIKFRNNFSGIKRSLLRINVLAYTLRRTKKY